MAHLFGIKYSINRSPSAPPLVQSGSYAYRRSNDYHFAFLNAVYPFGENGPIMQGLETTFTENSSEEGTVRCDHVSRITSATSSNVFGQWALISGGIETGDSRVTYNLGDDITTADLLPEVPANRWESDQLFIAGYIPGFGGAFWQFKPPLPLIAGFVFDGTTYTVRGNIPHGDLGPGPDFVPNPNGAGVNGRFIHADYSYAPGAIGGVCAVHGTHFSTLAEEVAHNSLSFQLAGGATSRTFETTQSTVAFPESTQSGTLPYFSNSEVAGVNSGRAYYPAIVRVTAQFVEPGRLRVDATSTISPTADVTGVVVRSTDAPVGRPTATPLGGRGLIDHYEIDGERFECNTASSGDFLPARVFDIVFKESDSEAEQRLYLQLRVTVDSPTFPATGDTLGLNWDMSIPALLYVAFTGEETIQTKAIVRPYGELKGRPNSQLWQYKINTHDMYAGEVGSGKGNVYRSTDEGETWQLMANAWNGVSGAKPLGFTAIPPSAAISMAKVGANIQTRYSPDKGQTWDAPVTVCPYAAGSWIIASHEYAGRDDITIANQTTGAKFVSTEAGAEGSWEAAT